MRKVGVPKTLEFLKKHRERTAVTGLLIGLVIFILLGLSLQKKNREVPVEPEEESSPAAVELELPRTGMNQGSEGQPPVIASFFLKPSPAELLSQLESMRDLNENVVTAKLHGLKVFWPVYFFSLEQAEGGDLGKRTLQADVEEDGFGIIVKADMDANDFPQLENVRRGAKIWIAGEILAVDPAGTGVIYLSAEHVRTGAGPVAGPDKTEQ